jgi:hypothetical protein
MTQQAESPKDTLSPKLPAGRPAKTGPDEVEPRICVPSMRNFRKVAYQGCLYEAQDVLAEICDADMICLEPGKGFSFKENWQRRLIWRDRTKKVATLNPGLKPVRLTRTYDLFVAVCQSYWDLLSLNAIKNWKENSRLSVCWMDELWAEWVPKFKNWLHLLNRFDHVFLNLRGTVRPVEEALRRKCHWLPTGVDTIRFSPYPHPPARVIDVYSLGRKWEGVHQSLLKRTAGNRIFYIYDTLNVNDTTLPDHRQHRDLIGNLAKRSRFFTVAPAKMNAPTDRGGQSEVGSRYFEGAAAGAVLIGSAPASESFEMLFGWEDSLFEINTDGSDILETLDNLIKSPERMAESGRRNAVESLLRHDWVYRWEAVFKTAGMNISPGMERRKENLRRLAKEAQGPT